MESHLSLPRSAPNLCISCSLVVLVETIETAAPPVAWPSLTWVSQRSWWLAGWHNTVLLPYAYHLSWLPDPTYARTHMLTYGMSCWDYTHVPHMVTHTQQRVLFLGTRTYNVHIRKCRCSYAEGQSMGNKWKCEKHMVWKIKFVWVGGRKRLRVRQTWIMEASRAVAGSSHDSAFFGTTAKWKRGEEEERMGDWNNLHAP